MRKILLHIIFIILAGASALTSHSQINTSQVMQIGRNAMYFEDYVLAIQYFNQAIQAKPYLAQPYFYRAIAKLNLEDYKGADIDATKAIELNPYITDAWEVRGVARQNMGHNKEAVSDYEQALQLLPRNRGLLFNKAMAQVDLKDYSNADSTFSTLLDLYPNFSNGLLGRARLRLAEGDTVRAVDDLTRALEIDPHSFNGYVMRADINIHKHADYSQALKDMEEAIKLQPHTAGLYVNRAFLRYSLDDYFGAMADYDYAIELDPLNSMAIFNRALLLSEVNANDRALKDFTTVLELDPDDTRALYNRAIIYKNKHQYAEAIADLNKVIEVFPDFAGVYYLRCDIYRQKGDMAKAERDYRKAQELSRTVTADKLPQAVPGAANESASDNDDDVPQQLVARRFASLLVANNNVDIENEYNNTDIRGKVQDREMNIDYEPWMQFTFYAPISDHTSGTLYLKEIDELNASRRLNFMIQITNKPPEIHDETIYQRHFQSINYYTSQVQSHTPRGIDFIGRGLDYLTLRNYPAAIDDFSRVIEMMPEYSTPWLMRAQARYENMRIARSDAASGTHTSDNMPIDNKKVAYRSILEDLDKALELNPDNVMAWYNKGTLYLEIGDYTSAISCYNHAIELKPDFGEAYYNRGYIYLKLGNRRSAIESLSKAGEYGIVSAYNLIKKFGSR